MIGIGYDFVIMIGYDFVIMIGYDFVIMMIGYVDVVRSFLYKA